MWEYIKLWIAKGIGEMLFALGFVFVFVVLYISISLFTSWRQSRRKRH